MVTQRTHSPANGSPGSHGPTRPAEWNERAYEFITNRIEALAERTMELHFQRRSELVTQYNNRQRALYFCDTCYNLTALASAMLLLTPGIFADHMDWVEHLLHARNIPTAGLQTHLECMSDTLAELLPQDLWQHTTKYIDAGLHQLTQTE